MNQRTSDIIDAADQGHHSNIGNIKNPGLGWIIAYVFAAGFLGLMAVVPLRKVGPFEKICCYTCTYGEGLL